MTLVPSSLPACPDENLLAAFASGALPSAKVLEVEAHLDGCAECRELVAAVAAESSLPGTGHSRTPTRLDTGLPTLSDPSPDTGLPPDTRLGPYVIRGVLGMGGMGVVYAADDSRLGRRVALKLLRPLREGAEEEGRARLLREAQAMARLSHPNVLPIFELGTAEGRDFLAMEWVEGTTLAEWLRERERPWREVLDVFLAAGAGLAAAHRAGLVHRDFKPSNVLVGFDGRVRVTDFGLARQDAAVPSTVQMEGRDEATSAKASVLTRHGQVAGTPAYMSPEQHAGHAVDARSDQYSFCVALHEAFEGERPSLLPSDAAPRNLPSRRRSQDLPRHIRAGLAQGLSPDPEQRFASMDALMTALTQPAGLPLRHRIRIVGAVLSLMALLAGFGVALWRLPSPEAPPAADAQLRAVLAGADGAPSAASFPPLRLNEVRELSVPGLRRVAVSDPVVLSVESLGNGKLRLTGEAEGSTYLVTWAGEAGQMEIFSVSVTAR
ncbi:Serine/threonine kinase PKN8 [Myxococcus hansupus]|uniref:Serine/threonine kinase PKN8 n=1 Tax=Pseudomyxococcus hansupus TaxID=1297742 RepID=A0A0H4X325_9BACT|nr:protein kinase [Myxococcus hansupus]AKQ70036.1 Serine/threonine kinase PKN8 [Myxococcus hansupus]